MPGEFRHGHEPHRNNNAINGALARRATPHDGIQRRIGDAGMARHRRQLDIVLDHKRPHGIAIQFHAGNNHTGMWTMQRIKFIVALAVGR